MSAPRVVILVPRRADGGHRDALWACCRARWLALFPDWPIFEGHHDTGPFNRSAAVNHAAVLADVEAPWDVAVVIDADIFLAPGQVRAAVELAASTGRVTFPHRRWRGLAQEPTERLLRDPAASVGLFGPAGFDGWDDGDEVRRRAVQATIDDVPVHGHAPTVDAILDALREIPADTLAPLVDSSRSTSWSSCLVVPRSAWETLGGFDERFRGWGGEDVAFAAASIGLVGIERLAGDVFHLWHPRSPERATRAGRNTPEYLHNWALEHRYTVALADLTNVDSSALFDENPMRRSRRDMVAWEAVQNAGVRGAPRWADWWPAMDELVSGSRAARGQAPSIEPIDDGPDRTVTLAVHTDGRIDYIAQSIPSLLGHVIGPITKRVIFDDSGDPAYKAWLDETFRPHGFYVVGPAERLGYAGSMAALWSYLHRRCDSEFVFLAEDDFVYDRDVELDPFIDVLTAEPKLRQIALLRGAWYPEEVRAGGIIEAKPDAHVKILANGHSRVEFRDWFTANPSLFRRSLTEIAWPRVVGSERAYTAILNRDPESRSAYWGDGTPWVQHIGAERAGAGY